MFKAKNGFTLKDATTKWGWEIKNANDLITALIGMPYFETVATDFIIEVLECAMEDRLVYEDINDLVTYIANNYI
jgi:hypothetical protein